MPIPRLGALLVACVLLVPSARAATDKSGLISGETWTATMSSIRIVGDITVARLTIEPGVEVLVTGDYAFDCQGILTAIGGPDTTGEGGQDDRIKFHGDTSVAWKGINFENSAPGSILKYCVIKDSHHGGVDVIDSFPTISHCEFDGNSAPGGGGGMYIKLETVSGTLAVSNCTFTGNSTISVDDYSAGGGLAAYLPSLGARLILADCDFLGNTCKATNGSTRGAGAYLYADPANPDSLELLRCTFKDNQARVDDFDPNIFYWSQGAGLSIWGGEPI